MERRSRTTLIIVVIIIIIIIIRDVCENLWALLVLYARPACVKLPFALTVHSALPVFLCVCVAYTAVLGPRQYRGKTYFRCMVPF